MITITKACQGELTYPFPCTRKELLFFDIETTGFSAKTSALYLIGALYYNENHWEIIQWFADDYESEKDLLFSFFTFLKKFSFLVHFNGNGFDIPFLMKKCQQHELTDTNYTFNKIHSYDIYKMIYPHRKRLNIENMKQKTLEAFLHISREDTYTGGELIAFYQKFLKIKETQPDRAKELQHFLLLHNQDDLAGMLQFSNILFLADLLSGNITFSTLSATKTDAAIQFTGTLPFHLDATFSAQTEDFLLSLKENMLTLAVSTCHATLKYFYDNYKDYFYLPKEDTAIHKSVATYVDKEFRQKAKKENCYIKKEGHFLPSYSTQLKPVFRTDYASKEYFILLDDASLQSNALLNEYINSFLRENKQLLLCS